MEATATCERCQRPVSPERPGMNVWLATILWLPILPGLIYYGLHLLKPKTQCPICGESVIESEEARP